MKKIIAWTLVAAVGGYLFVTVIVPFMSALPLD
jgi:hypothetical protein